MSWEAIKARTRRATAIEQNYLKASSQEEKDRVGLLASAYAKKYGDFPEGSVLSKVAADPRYDMPDAKGIPQDKLTDVNGVNNQLMIFPDDQKMKVNDGRVSFEHWQNTYKDPTTNKDIPGWKTDEKATYVEISSTGGKVPVHIFANKPDHYEDGLAAINSEVASRQGTKDASFQVMVGRGHMYHADEYLKRVDPSMSLVHLGSCGSDQNIEKVFEKVARRTDYHRAADRHDGRERQASARHQQVHQYDRFDRLGQGTENAGCHRKEHGQQRLPAAQQQHGAGCDQTPEGTGTGI